MDFDKLTSVEISGAKLHLTFASEDGKWTVRSPANLRGDTSKMETIIEKLRTATMDPSASDADTKKAASLFASGSPIATIKATDASGSQELQVRKASDAYYAKTAAMDGVIQSAERTGRGGQQGCRGFSREEGVRFRASRIPTKLKCTTEQRLFPDAQRRGLVVRRKEDGCRERPGISALDSHA